MEYSELKKIIKDMEESKLAEVSIEFPDGTKISMKNRTELPVNQIPILPNIPMTVAPNVKPTVVSEKKELINVEQNNENLKVVKSPMVGTFYEKASPTAKKYVEVGQNVKKGAL